MMHGMMDGGMTAMMWGMGLIGLLLLVLAIAALAKYVFGRWR